MNDLLLAAAIAFSGCDSIPADQILLKTCAAISARDWQNVEGTAKSVADLAIVESAATDDPDRLRAVVADLIGYVAYLKAKEEQKDGRIEQTR